MKLGVVAALAAAVLVAGGGLGLAQSIGSPGYEIKYGNEYYGAKEYDLAAMRYSQAIQLDPENGEAHFLLAKAYFKLGRNAEASAELEKAYALDPDLRGRAGELPLPKTASAAPAPDGWTGLKNPPGGAAIGTSKREMYYGKDYLAEHEYALAAMRFRQALELDPDNAEAAFWLAGAYRGQGMNAEGKAALARAYELDPSLKAHENDLFAFSPPPPKPVAKAAPKQSNAKASNSCDDLYSACYASATRCSLYNNQGCSPDFGRQSLCLSERNACYARNGKK